MNQLSNPEKAEKIFHKTHAISLTPHVLQNVARVNVHGFMIEF